MHVNVRTTLHDRKTTLSQTRSPEIKAKKTRIVFKKGWSRKKFKNIKRETIQNLCWWPWCTPYSKSVFILNSFIPLPEGYLLCCSYTQHSCQICWFWHEMHIMVEKNTNIYISILGTPYDHKIFPNTLMPNLWTYESKNNSNQTKVWHSGGSAPKRKVPEYGIRENYQPLWMSSLLNGIPKFGSEGRNLSQDITLGNTLA